MSRRTAPQQGPGRTCPAPARRRPHTEPMPEDLVVRLDRVLAELAEHARHRGRQHAVELASRRSTPGDLAAGGGCAPWSCWVSVSARLYRHRQRCRAATASDSRASAGEGGGAAESGPAARQPAFTEELDAAVNPVAIDSSSFAADVARTRRQLRSDTLDSDPSNMSPHRGRRLLPEPDHLRLRLRPRRMGPGPVRPRHLRRSPGRWSTGRSSARARWSTSSVVAARRCCAPITLPAR